MRQALCAFGKMSDYYSLNFLLFCSGVAFIVGWAIGYFTGYRYRPRA